MSTTDTAAVRPEPTEARDVPLDQIPPAEANEMVKRIVAKHVDESRIPAAKFSSFI